MRESIKQFVKTVADTLPIKEPIYEFGSMQVPGQEGFADLRSLFPGKEYVGCDFREGLGVDKVLNLHGIDLPDNTAGTVLCLDTMEHVEFPHKAAAELQRITQTGGMIVLSSVMNFPIHEYPYDYWRFTPEAFKSILAPFDEVFVGAAGEELFPHTVIGVAFKGQGSVGEEFLKRYEQWKRNWYNAVGNNSRQFRRRWIPPALYGFRFRNFFK